MNGVTRKNSSLIPGSPRTPIPDVRTLDVDLSHNGPIEKYDYF
jgi:hypothetical protein